MRPFLLWAAVAAVVVGVYEHRRRSAGTVLCYSVTVDGEPPKAGEVEVTLHWREVKPWALARARPGEHRFRVEHPGCERLDVSLAVAGSNVARSLVRAREQEAAGRAAGALAEAREALRLRPGLADTEAIKHAILQTAGGLGFSYRVEQPVLDGTGRVDLVLERGPLVVAVEISATTPAEHEVGNLLKCLHAGFTHIVHVCDAPARGRRIEELLAAQTTAGERAKMRRLTLRQALDHLRQLAQEAQAAEPAAGAPGKTLPANPQPLTPAEQQALMADMHRRIAERQRRARDETG